MRLLMTGAEPIDDRINLIGLQRPAQTRGHQTYRHGHEHFTDLAQQGLVAEDFEQLAASRFQKPLRTRLRRDRRR